MQQVCFNLTVLQSSIYVVYIYVQFSGGRIIYEQFEKETNLAGIHMFELKLCENLKIVLNKHRMNVVSTQ